MQDSIKLALADDHQKFLRQLTVMLKRHEQMEIVGEAKDGSELLDILKHSKVDIAILDIEMPRLDGIETLKKIKKNYVNIKVIILSEHGQKQYVLNILQQGAAGYLLKEKSSEELIKAIHEVYEGGRYYPANVMQTLSRENSKKPHIQLAKMEIRVLKLLAQQHTPKQIAEEISTTIHTVNTHIANLQRKTKSDNNADLVQFAKNHGYVLTKTEIKVLELLAQNSTVEQISTKLALDKSVIYRYKRSLLTKTNSLDMEELLDFARENGFIWTKVELEITQFLALGLTVEQIAKKLLVKINSVKRDLKHMLRKTNSPNEAYFIRFMKKEGHIKMAEN